MMQAQEKGTSGGLRLTGWICGRGPAMLRPGGKNGAEGGTRTPMGCPTRPSNVRVYQFHHFGKGTIRFRLREIPALLFAAKP
jgi:hypothetical protein